MKNNIGNNQNIHIFLRTTPNFNKRKMYREKQIKFLSVIK